jgi:hypothetical protein
METAKRYPWRGSTLTEIQTILGSYPATMCSEHTRNLIAAAPEMFAALELVRKSATPEQDPIAMFALIERVRHVIAKATGKEHGEV